MFDKVSLSLMVVGQIQSLLFVLYVKFIKIDIKTYKYLPHSHIFAIQVEVEFVQ